MLVFVPSVAFLFLDAMLDAADWSEVGVEGRDDVDEVVGVEGRDGVDAVDGQGDGADGPLTVDLVTDDVDMQVVRVSVAGQGGVDGVADRGGVDLSLIHI